MFLAESYWLRLDRLVSKKQPPPFAVQLQNLADRADDLGPAKALFDQLALALQAIARGGGDVLRHGRATVTGVLRHAGE